MPDDLLHGATTVRASCGSRRSAAWCSAASRTTCRRSRNISARRSLRASSACWADARRSCSGRYHAGAAEQLEALHREREGHLSREHPAPVLHHLRAQPAVAEGGHHRRSERRPSRQLLRDRPTAANEQRLRRAEPPLRQRVRLADPIAAAELRRISATASRCRSCRSSRPSCCSRSRTRIAVRQIVPRGSDRTELHWTYFGFADDTPEQRLRAAEAGESGRARRLHLDGGRLRRRLRAARHRRRAGDERAVIEMGGAGTEPARAAVTEASVRGFWKAYRAQMGI